MFASRALSLAILFSINILLFLASGFFGEAAFGGLQIYGPNSPPARPLYWPAAGAFAVAFPLSCVSYVLLLLKAGVTLGGPDTPSSSRKWLFLLSLLLSVPALGEGWVQKTGSPWLLAAYGAIVMVPSILVMSLCLRGLSGMAAIIVCAGLTAIPSQTGSFGQLVSNGTITFFFFIPARCTHLCHHRITTIFACLYCTIYVTGSQLYLDPSTGWSLIPIEVAGSYLLALWLRRKRSLPPALRHCRFLRLGYLRKMAREGKRIVRSQLMPEEAFGNPEFAEVLVVTSHRWMDRFTCDVFSEAYPKGLRLTTMAERVSGFFPEAAPAVWAGWTAWSRFFYSLIYGGNDVLIFFDFVSLPQVGIAEDRAIIPRSPTENAAFCEALPAMGALYTMYPVLVLPEVTEDVASYWGSGWCFSEFSSALLTGRLDEFSRAMVEACVREPEVKTTVEPVLGRMRVPDSGARTQQPSLMASTIPVILAAFEADLKTKLFFDEGDRSIVHGIVKGYLLLRQLWDAVQEHRASDVDMLLRELLAAGLQQTLDQAVGPSLDTLLHLAVRAGNVEITRALLRAGSSPSLRNLRGDKPSQLFMWPRSSAAAELCRQREGGGRWWNLFEQSRGGYQGLAGE